MITTHVTEDNIEHLVKPGEAGPTRPLVAERSNRTSR